MEEDEELRRIWQRKMEELMERAKSEKLTLGKPIELTEAKFREVIQNHPLVVVDCWAPWCAPCFMIAPILDELARDYAGRILFGKLNVDENQKIAMQYDIMSIPALLLFKNGKLVDRIIGAMPKQIIEPKITRHL